MLTFENVSYRICSSSEACLYKDSQ